MKPLYQCERCDAWTEHLVEIKTAESILAIHICQECWETMQ